MIDDRTMTILNARMTSLDIAKVTGKEHRHVLRDLRKLEREGAIVGLPKFGQTSFDSQGKERTIYNLPKRETLILTSGYSSIQRAAIIDRWLDLEGHTERALKGEEEDRRILEQAEQVIQLRREQRALASSQDRLFSRQDMVELVQTTVVAQLAALVKGEDYFTVVGYANRIKLRLPSSSTSGLGKRATRICRDHGWKIGRATHPTYGEVNTYPSEALASAFEEAGLISDPLEQS